MKTKLQEAINQLPVIQKAHIYEPTIENVAEISFKAGQEEEYKKWVKAFEVAGILIASADKVGIAIEETKRAGIKEVVRWIKSHQLIKPDKDSITRFEPFYQIEKAKLKEWGKEDGQD